MDLGIITLSIIMAMHTTSPALPVAVDLNLKQCLAEATFEELSWPVFMQFMPVPYRD